jgi:hypothetical protein
MPLFSFAKEGFDPYLALAKGLFIGFSRPIPLRTVQIILKKGTPEMSPAFTVGASRFHWTSITDFRFGRTVDKLLLTVTALIERQVVALRTDE